MKVNDEKITFVKSVNNLCEKFIAIIENLKVNLLIDFLQSDKLGQK